VLKLQNNEVSYTKEDNSSEVKVSSHGIDVINRRSYEALEEDLQALAHNELNIPIETVKNCIDTGINKVLSSYAKYVKPEALQKLGLESPDQKNINHGTTFKFGNVKAFVLNSDNFDMFKDAYETNPTRGESFGSPVAIERRGFIFGKEVVNAHYETVGDSYLFIVKAPDDAKPKSLRQLESITRHEFMHTLGFGNMFPSYITEGVVHYYQGEINGKPAKTLAPERQHATNFVTNLTQKLEALGVTKDEINAILIGNDKQAFEQSLNIFGAAYGDKNAKKVFSGMFSSAEEAETFINSLERE
jgi:hypothetical protein